MFDKYFVQNKSSFSKNTNAKKKLPTVKVLSKPSSLFWCNLSASSLKGMIPEKSHIIISYILASREYVCHEKLLSLNPK